MTMDRAVLVALAVGVAVVVGYLLVMRVFFKDSKDLDKKIDYSKVKEWKDDED
jgi:low affinity Fe/Cu permease